MGADPVVVLSDEPVHLRAEAAPRPPRCYDPAVRPYRDEQGVHVHDHRTVRGLLRDPQRVTSDVTEMLTAEQRDRLHPVSAFVWATDRKTLSGCPGRHAALRSVMAPWFTPQEADARQGPVRAACARLAARHADHPFDVYHDYALPVVVAYLADWLGVDEADVTYAIGDQLAAGDMFDTWPALATPEMDDHYRALMARPDLHGVTARVRDLVRSGVLGEREAWGIVYAYSVSAVATATTITLTVGLGVEHGLWHRMTDVGDARGAVEEAVRLGSPFPQASRFAREPFTLGDLAVEPGEQVLMWLTAANRDLPGRHRRPLDRYDPWRDTSQHVGWGSGYHLCGGVHHARAVAATAVVALAQGLPQLGLDGPWRRFAGIDDGFAAAPAVPSDPAGEN
jgi:cytochrome P450